MIAAETNGVKKAKVDTAVIGTHNGKFHCDEVLACFMLRQLPEYAQAEIVRSRDLAVLDKCDIVVDVGNVFDKTIHRYDHHMRTFSETMNSLRPEKEWTTKLSSAGLVYCHFGERVIASVLGIDVKDPCIDKIYNKVYANFIEEIDGIDNGVNPTDEKPRYKVCTNISSRVSHLSPAWNSPCQDTDPGFYKAIQMVGAEFVDRVKFYYDAWLPARVVVETAFNNRFKVDESGAIMELPGGGCPWKEHLSDIEDEKNEAEETPEKEHIMFVIFPEKEADGPYRVQGVNKSEGFELRLPLREEWRGVRSEELSEKSGIPGCVFVHSSGFIGGNQTREGALSMARKTLQLETKQ